MIAGQGFLVTCSRGTIGSASNRHSPLSHPSKGPEGDRGGARCGCWKGVCRPEPHELSTMFRLSAMTAARGGGLVVVGTGGFGRETVEAVRAINFAGASWRLLGYLDDDPLLAGTHIDGVAVLGGTEKLRHLSHAAVVVCSGRPG